MKPEAKDQNRKAVLDFSTSIYDFHIFVSVAGDKNLEVVNPIWSQAEKATLREKFDLGWNDEQISQELGRSKKAVQAKRRKLELVVVAGSERAKNKKDRTYSRDDDMNILGRYLNGDKPGAIALDYGVTSQAISNKIDRLIDKGIKEKPTPRGCILCQKAFYSIHSRSIHRRCPLCDEAVRKQGTCFLTAW